jgi:hypothetical protein
MSITEYVSVKEASSAWEFTKNIGKQMVDTARGFGKNPAEIEALREAKSRIQYAADNLAKAQEQYNTPYNHPLSALHRNLSEKIVTEQDPNRNFGSSLDVIDQMIDKKINESSYAGMAKKLGKAALLGAGMATAQIGVDYLSDKVKEKIKQRKEMKEQALAEQDALPKTANLEFLNKFANDDSKGRNLNTMLSTLGAINTGLAATNAGVQGVRYAREADKNPWVHGAIGAGSSVVGGRIGGLIGSAPGQAMANYHLGKALNSGFKPMVSEGGDVSAGMYDPKDGPAIKSSLGKYSDSLWHRDVGSLAGRLTAEAVPALIYRRKAHQARRQKHRRRLYNEL